ncbi:MAG: tol-pal system protein YbgF [Paracoccaceae bacterium]
MQRFLVFLLALVLATSVSSPLRAQDETLADIRQELSVLFVDLQRLRRELSTTGGMGAALGASSVLERVDLIEAELVRLTSKTEQLENRINRIVKDGTNRLGDLEFRLVELEGGDLSQLGETSTLGGDVDGFQTTVQSAIIPDSEPELAVGEQSDFNLAVAALEAGDFADANLAFAAFTDTYTGGPLTGDAHFFRGEALFALGDTANAARAYLESFSGSPDSRRAPEALFRLGVALGALGQANEACISLREVGVRFPGADVVPDAQNAMLELNCQ